MPIDYKERRDLINALRDTLHELGEFIDLNEGSCERRVADELVDTIAYQVSGSRHDTNEFARAVWANFECCVEPMSH